MREAWKRAYESTAYSVTLIVLILIAGVFLALEFLILREPSEDFLALALDVDLAVSLLFLTDYAIGLWLAEHRRRYIFSGAGILNLISSLPFPQGALQGLRFLKFSRALRGLRAARAVRGVRVVMQGESLVLRKRGRASRSARTDGRIEP